MSARGCIAVGTPKNWKGIYNHSDSYPTCMGPELWEHLIRQQLEGKTLAEIGHNILSFDDWRNYLKAGLCEYCGKVTGQAHSVRSDVYTKAHAGLYPDPDATFHEHNDLTADHYISSDDPDPLFIEWVYVIDPDANAVHILTSEGRPAKKGQHREIPITTNGKTNYGTSVYWHEHIITLSINDKPNWTHIECGVNLERCQHYAWYHNLAPKTSNLSTQTFLGKRPLEFRDAVAFVIDGKRYKATGCGGNSNYFNRNGKSFPRDTWIATVQAGNGKRIELPVAKITSKGYEPLPGVILIYPPTKSNPNETEVRESSVTHDG